jgi:hypothetical protein
MEGEIPKGGSSSGASATESAAPAPAVEPNNETNDLSKLEEKVSQAQKAAGQGESGDLLARMETEGTLTKTDATSENTEASKPGEQPESQPWEQQVDGILKDKGVELNTPLSSDKAGGKAGGTTEQKNAEEKDFTLRTADNPNPGERKAGETDAQFEQRRREVRQKARQGLEEREANGTATDQDKTWLKNLREAERNDQQQAKEDPKTKKDGEESKAGENGKTENLTQEQQLANISKGLGERLKGKDIETAMVNVPAKDLLLLLKAFAEADESDPKKKEGKLSIILKILGVLFLGGVMHVAESTAEQATQG